MPVSMGRHRGLNEAQLLREAIAEYAGSLQSIAEALEASPGEAELLELKQQLESALQEAEAALAGLGDAAPAADAALDAGAPAPVAQADAAEAAAAAAGPAEPEAAAAGPAPRPAAGIASQPRAAAARGNARIHPRSKYAFEEPDFAALAQLYPSLQPFLLHPRGGRPGSGGADGGVTAAAEVELAAAAATAPADKAAVAGPADAPAAAGPADGPPASHASAAGSAPRASLDFTSPAACRELTRVLFRHDFGLEWWVPLGQLVPPVTNRANYLHWLEDLLSLSAPKGPVAGLDIGCGANLIYCLLGAALCGWRMVGADVTPAALAWAARNLGANPQLAGLVEVRAVGMQPEQRRFHEQLGSGGGKNVGSAGGAQHGGEGAGSGSGEAGGSGEGQGGPAAVAAAAGKQQGDDSTAGVPPAIAAAQPAPVARLAPGQAAGGGIISGAVRRGERFAFCMCNPPFFESLEEAGRNPATAFGGTAEEMVYPGGELAFVSAMVQDSLELRGAVHWYTTMVGKKGTLRAARSLLYRHGVRALRTTELAQGKTSRWALAWSFTADANAASQPLPRFPNTSAPAAAPAPGAAAGQRQPRQAAGGATAAAAGGGRGRPVGRKLSWQVQAPARAGGAVLAAIRQCMQQAGMHCADAGPYSLCCKHTPTPGQLAAAAGDAEEPVAKRARPGATGDGSGAPQAQQQQQQQRWQIDLQLFQQHAGLFLLVAVLQKSAPDGALPWFGEVAQRLQRALAAQWAVQT
ncbi:hypothetical protein ABPG75_002467 [Micractinium tetrahymenae]